MRRFLSAAICSLLPAVLTCLAFAVAAAEGVANTDCAGSGCHEVPSPDVTVHEPVSSGRCVSCHQPGKFFAAGKVHSLDAFQGEASEKTHCLTCHPEEVRKASAPGAHQPARENDCSTCHSLHSSTYPDLLKERYPAGMYASFETDAYALCWGCHDVSLGEEKFTTSATGFRQGARNFHYSHLHKRKGVSCRSCHDPHGSGQPFSIRREAPLSGWEGAMVFQKNGRGGRCIGGCHKNIVYNP
jgi:predicted CXXCH cytochrome family protein